MQTVMVAFALLAASQISAKVKPESIAWGEPANYLRLGLSVDKFGPSPKVRLFLKNLSGVTLDLQVGSSMGTAGPSYHNLTFITTAPRGKKTRWFWNSGMQVSGVMSLIIATVPAHQVYEITIPRDEMIFSVDPSKQTSLDAALKTSASLRVTLKEGLIPMSEKNTWWGGQATSGEFRYPQETSGPTR
jgi:hypothetical protein